MSNSTIKHEGIITHSVLEDEDSESGTELYPLGWTLFEDSAFSSTVHAGSQEESISGSKKNIGHPSTSKKRNSIVKVSKPRISFNLKRYLRGLGALDLLTLQRERREPLLHTAVKENRKDVVEVLIGRGTDPNIRGFSGTTPLHEAAARGHTDILQVLLKYGADVAAETSMGETPLLLARLAGNDGAVILLLAAGAEGFFEGEGFEMCDAQRSL